MTDETDLGLISRVLIENEHELFGENSDCSEQVSAAPTLYELVSKVSEQKQGQETEDSFRPLIPCCFLSNPAKDSLLIGLLKGNQLRVFELVISSLRLKPIRVLMDSSPLDSFTSILAYPNPRYPDSVLIGTQLGLIRLVNYNDESQEGAIVLRGHGRAVCSMEAIDQNLNFIVSNSLDLSFRLWDLRSGQCLCSINHYFDQSLTGTNISRLLGNRVLAMINDQTKETKAKTLALMLTWLTSYSHKWSLKITKLTPISSHQMLVLVLGALENETDKSPMTTSFLWIFDSIKESISLVSEYTNPLELRLDNCGHQIFGHLTQKIGQCGIVVIAESNEFCSSDKIKLFSASEGQRENGIPPAVIVGCEPSGGDLCVFERKQPKK